MKLAKNNCASKFAAALSLAAALLLGGSAAYAAETPSQDVSMQQQITVRGVVVDAQGLPVPGAGVVQKGTTNGTMTADDGTFRLNAPAGAILEVSCIGYGSAEVAAAASVRVVLSEDSEYLDELVVVGFGAQKKINLTGAVASVNMEKQLNSRPIADVSRGLQGSVPGMTVQIGSGEVGADARIRIRGQIGSNLGGSDPLILLDNVEIPTIQMVNPDDIESISVLKDAASASIYGAKAAFGVILITSKKGAETESVNVSYSGNIAFSSIAQQYDMADVDALHYTVEAAERVGTFTPVGAFWLIDRAGYNAAVAWKQKYANLDPQSPLTYGRDWYVNPANVSQKIGVRTYNPYDYVINNAAPTQTHNLSVAGKKGNTSFNVNLGYIDQDGLMKTAKEDDFRRWNASVRLNTQVNNWLSVRGNMMFSKHQKRWAYASSSTSADVWYYLYRWGPTYPLVPVDEYGNNVRNFTYETANANTADNSYTYTSITAGTTITPLKNWNIDFDYTYATRNEIAWRPGTVHTGGDTWSAGVLVPGKTVTNEWAEYNQAGSTIPAYQLNVYNYASSFGSYDHVYRSAYTSQRQTYIAKTTYDLNIAKDHQFNFLLGFQAVDYKNEGNWSRRYELLDYSNPQFDLAIGEQFVGGGFSWESQAGAFGRINYAYKDKYLLEANLRYDGSSKFPKHLKWRWFPSFSAGWIVTEEPWMKGLTDVLSFFKVRGSWGTIGDQTVSNSLYIPTISSSTTSWLEGGSPVKSYGTPAAVASDITWQDITTLDFGADIRLFRSLGITFDWFNRKTSNMIVPLEGIGYGFGTTAPNGNYGSLSTRGWELSLDYGHMFNNGLSLSVRASLADAVTTIDEYGSGTIVTNWYNGKTYGEIWGFEVDRLFTKDDFVYDANGNLVVVQSSDGYNVYQFKDPNMATQGKYNSGSAYFGPGDVKYKDLNGDGVINDGSNTLDDHGDLTVIGNTTPRYEYSFGIDLGYKGFDFRVFFQGIGKRQLWGDGPLAIPGYNSSDGAMPQTFAGDFWYETKDGAGNVVDANYDAFYPRALNGGAGGNSFFNFKPSDRYLLNMAYLRLKNVTLGYTLPSKLTKKANIKNLRIYTSLENFLTFDHLKGLPIDPEEIPGVSYYDSSNYNSGRTGVGVPAMKTASLGVQITF